MSEQILKAASFEDAINDVFTTGDATPEEEVSVPVVQEPAGLAEKSLEQPEPIVLNEDTLPENVEVVEIPAEPEVKEIIKEVEKEITFKDELSEKLYNALQSGDEEAEKIALKYLSTKYTDYGSMSSLDVLREKIKLEKPHWDASDIDGEIEARYGLENSQKYDLSLIDKELDPEDYKNAERHNKEVERLEKLRERDAKDARIFLESQKPSSIELPSTKREVVADATQPTQEEIERQAKEWSDQVDAQMTGFSDLRFKVGNEEITYKLTEDDKASQKDYMKKTDIPTLFRDLGWVDENGSDNILKVAEDVHFLKNRAKIIASIGTHMKTIAKKEVVSKDIKNIDLEARTQVSDAPKQSFADLALGL